MIREPKDSSDKDLEVIRNQGQNQSQPENSVEKTKNEKKTNTIDNSGRPTIWQSAFGLVMGFGVPAVTFFAVIFLFDKYSTRDLQWAYGSAFVLSIVFFVVADKTHPYRAVWSKAILMAIFFWLLCCQVYYWGFSEYGNKKIETIETKYTFSGEAGDIKDVYIPWKEYSSFGSVDCDYDLICQGDTVKYRDNKGYYGGTLKPGPTYYRLIFRTKGEVKFDPGNKFR